MFKQCRYCGFKNPPDIEECLSCHKKLPMTVGEFKEGIEVLKKAAKGDWGRVAKKSVDDFVGEKVSSVKYRFNPIWVLKVKLHRLKKALVNIFWIFAIIGGIVILGLIFNFFSKLFKGG